MCRDSGRTPNVYDIHWAFFHYLYTWHQMCCFKSKEYTLGVLPLSLHMTSDVLLPWREKNMHWASLHHLYTWHQMCTNAQCISFTLKANIWCHVKR
jgi:hypothetical protein